MKSPLLTVNNLEVQFRGSNRHSNFRAVDNVSFTIEEGETVGLVGESGSGKTTIGRSILGLQKASAGSITFDGRDATSVARRLRRELARDLQVIFQDPNSSLNPLMSVGQILAEPLRSQGIDPADAQIRVANMLHSVGLPAGSENRYSAQFSGGQRQRVAIARALVLSPKLVVCDEPVSALDLSTQAQIVNLLADLRDTTGVSYLFISHDLSVVRYLADRIVVLYRGQIMEIGDSEEVSDRPQHPYTIALNAASPVTDVEQQQVRREKRREAITLRPEISVGEAGCPFASRCPFMAKICLDKRPRLIATSTTSVACHMFDPTSGHPKQIETTRIGS
jgi:oligopeptide/dipeptide ABC transporter ATP-binding protein